MFPYSISRTISIAFSKCNSLIMNANSKDDFCNMYCKRILCLDKLDSQDRMTFNAGLNKMR